MKVTEHFCDQSFVDETLVKLSMATQDDLIIIGDGELFMDYFTPFWEGFREFTAQVPFYIWGVGYCDLKREPSRAPQELLEEIIHKRQFCIVRDKLSRKHLSRCALPQLVPYPSVCVVERPHQIGYGLLHVDNYTTTGPDVYKAMDDYRRNFAKSTNRPYMKTNNRIPAGNEVALERTMKSYEAADIILSSALHGCIFAATLGKKILAVSGDYKMESFMHAAGLSDWVCNISEVDSLPELLPSARWFVPKID